MIKIGILCPSEIAFRRFMPALKKCTNYQYIGIAVASKEEWFSHSINTPNIDIQKATISNELEKAKAFQKEFDGQIFLSYEELLSCTYIDAVYIPLPPALHYRWAKKAMKNDKHVLVEKPSTISNKKTEELIALAKEKKLAFHENYMFVFHEQLKEIQKIIDEKILGDVRMYRLDFGFPRRATNDFRYSSNLGGGALFDCGGYTLRYASALLGEKTKIDTAKLNYIDEFKVDLYGSATLSNEAGETVQLAFGMDNAYKCQLEVWGSRGRLVTGRIFTAPAGFTPTYTLITSLGKEEYELTADDTFHKSLLYFSQCIESEEIRENSYRNILRQAALIDSFIQKAETWM